MTETIEQQIARLEAEIATAEKPEQRIELQLELARRFSTTDFLRAIELGRRLVEETEARGGLLHVRALADVGLLLTSQPDGDQVTEGLEYHLRARSLAASMGPLARAYVIVRYPAWCLRGREDALALHRHAVEEIDASGLSGSPTDWMRCSLHGSISYLLLLEGEFEASAEAGLRAIDAGRASGSLYHLTIAQINAGSAMLATNDFERASLVFRDAIEGGRVLGDPFLSVNALSAMAGLHRKQGQFADALPYYEQLIQLADGVPLANSRVDGRLGRAKCLQAAGNLDEALVVLHEAHDLLTDAASPEMRVAVDKVLASVLAARGDLAFARAHAETAVQYARQHSLNLYVESTSELLCEICERQCDYQAALAYLKECEAMRRKLFTEESDRRLKTLTIKHESEQLRAANELQQLRLENMDQRLRHLQSELSRQIMVAAREAERFAVLERDLIAIMEREPTIRGVRRAVSERLKSGSRDNISWTTIEAEFVAVHPRFQESLRTEYPALTKMERRVCILLRLGLSSADIAHLLSLSVRTVDFHRRSIRLKLGLRTKDNLAAFLSSL